MKSKEYHLIGCKFVYNWSKRGLPFFWDICEDLKDGTQWICSPPIDGKEIKLLSRFVYTDGMERKVRVRDFTKHYKIVKATEVYGDTKNK